MLDSETKRRIDTARDILVGKVPDPKSQVEQITIALIYKFMDDMDAQAEEVGGKRKFFTKEFAPYGWAKLMAPSVSGEERIALYADGMVKMTQNPAIPPLFRSIFKNAYLPYRDPETLKAFLKTINEFSYDHSERLGDAFEYLLSVLGSQGDAGQFRTPRHIIDFIVAIVDPKKNETVLDPACGTAGFLISAYKHILRANSSPAAIAKTNGNGEAALHTSKIPPAKGDKLTPDERKRLADNFRGYDISPDMVRLSLVNMYLHGFKDPHVYEYDTLTSQDRWNEMADVILANPPFMSPKGGIKPHNRFSVASKRSEVLFVDYMAEHLTPSGRAGIIVPEGIIFQSQTAYEKLRKMLIDGFLVGVISLPSGVFQPYTSVKTSILIFDRSEAKRNPNIMFSDVRHIGFSLGVKRAVTEQNDLPQIESDYIAYYRGGEMSHHSWLAARKSILANGCNLTGGHYKPKVKVGNTEMVSLTQLLAPVEREEALDPAREYRFLGVKWYAKGLFVKDKIRGSEVKATKAYRVEAGDFVYNRLFAWKGSFALAEESVHGCHVSNEFPCFRIDESRVHPRFLLFLFSAERLWSESFENSSGTSTTSRNRLKENELLSFEIPLPPLEVQEEIVAEIEAYQKVIDGARAVRDHYRPHVPTNPEWPVVELREVIERYNEIIHPGDRKSGESTFVGMEHIEEGTGKRIGSIQVDLAHMTGRKPTFKKGHIVYGYLRPYLNKVWIAEFDGCSSVDQFAFKVDRQRAETNFVATFLRSDAFLRQSGRSTTNAQLPRISIGEILGAKIPLPPLADQQKIVAEIEAEQRLVDANRELVERMEQKIAAALARIWGETPEQAGQHALATVEA